MFQRISRGKWTSQGRFSGLQKASGVSKTLQVVSGTFQGVPWGFVQFHGIPEVSQSEVLSELQEVPGCGVLQPVT